MTAMVGVNRVLKLGSTMLGDVKVDETLELTVPLIKKWARQHFEYTGRWPAKESGQVFGQGELTWKAVDRMLRRGGQGLRGGSSLMQVVKASGGTYNTRKKRPGLTVKQILEWADSHHMRTGEWPTRDSGPVLDAPDIAWGTIEKRLRRGDDTLPGGSSLAMLLKEARGVWDGGKPRLTTKLILKWADQHYAATGKWPITTSGPLIRMPNENWAAIDMALRNARRGIQQKTSLSRLLQEHRGDLYYPEPPALSIKDILNWAQTHHKRTGKWPTRKSGAVYGGPGVTWATIDVKLSQGGRGLPGGTSLSKLIREHKRNLAQDTAG
jgi:hypothetical protein